MAVPVEASEIERFTPDSLRNLPAPPVFLLRPATGREWRQYQHALTAEGLMWHSKESYRAEALKGLEQLWSPDAFATGADRLKQHWLLIDQKQPVPPAEQAAVDELSERLARAWPPLSMMLADNERFTAESLKVALSMFLVGWESFDLPYAREAGRVPLPRIDAVETKLSNVAKEALAGNIEGVGAQALPFLQLCVAASAKMNLTEAEEKNSESPPLSSGNRNGSRTTSKTKAAGPSRISGRSRKIPATSSPPTTA
jgi:hypothetical protein